MENKNEIRIEIPKFVTHIPKSKNSFVKINGQRLYTGVNHYLRSKIVREIHKFVKNYIPSDLDISHMLPIRIKLEFHSPINYGNVQMRKDNNGTYRVMWKKPDDNFVPKWDVDNQWIWGKCFNDMLTELKIIPDDNVSIIKAAGEVEFFEVENFEDRKLVFVISKA